MKRLGSFIQRGFLCKQKFVPNAKSKKKLLNFIKTQQENMVLSLIVKNVAVKSLKFNKKLTVNIIKSIQKNGNNSIDNIQLLCPPCNYTKAAKLSIGLK